MLTDTPSLNAALSLGAMAWPLMAGLSVVMWSRLRAAQAQAVRVRDHRR